MPRCRALGSRPTHRLLEGNVLVTQDGRVRVVELGHQAQVRRAVGGRELEGHRDGLADREGGQGAADDAACKLYEESVEEESVKVSWCTQRGCLSGSLWGTFRPREARRSPVAVGATTPPVRNLGESEEERKEVPAGRSMRKPRFEMVAFWVFLIVTLYVKGLALVALAGADTL